MIRIFVAVLLGAASAFVGIQLLRGHYLNLVYNLSDIPGHEKQAQEKTAHAVGELAATVTFAFFAADICLLFFELGRSLDVVLLAQIFSIASDISMIAYLIVVVRLFAKLGTTKDPKAKYKASSFRVTAYVLVLCALLTLLALLF